MGLFLSKVLFKKSSSRLKKSNCIEQNNLEIDEKNTISTVTEETQIRQHILGYVKFSLRYDVRLEKLKINVINAGKISRRNLAELYVNISDTNSFFHSLKSKTCVIVKAHNPVWREEFVFENVKKTNLPQLCINLKLCAKRKFWFDRIIGEMHIPCEKVDMAGDDEPIVERMIQPRPSWLNFFKTSCKILLSLSYDTENKTLNVYVIKIKGLSVLGYDQKSCPYLTLTLGLDDGIIDSFKTNIVIKSVDPIFYESFDFDIDSQLLVKSHLTIFVRDYQFGSSSDRIGSSCLGTDTKIGCGADGYLIWHKLLESLGSGETVSHWLKLENISKAKYY